MCTTVVPMKPTATIEPLHNLYEAAQITGRSHWSLRKDIRAGRLNAVRIGKRWMVEPKELRAFIARGRQV